MSGHNKWSTIKHKKAAVDAKRGKIFSRISKEIIVSVRQSGADPNTNSTLRGLIQKARSENMPSDNVERSIKRGTGDTDGVIIEELSYEGYAPGGVALLVESLSDNKNRTAAEVKHAFTRHGGNLAAQGSVSRLFRRKGQISVAEESAKEDTLMELVLEAGAEDMALEDGQFNIVTEPADFMTVVDALNQADIPTTVSELTMIPDITVPVTEYSKATSLIKFIEALEDLDDVQNVYSNFDLDDDLMKKLEGE